MLVCMNTSCALGQVVKPPAPRRQQPVSEPIRAAQPAPATPQPPATESYRSYYIHCLHWKWIQVLTRTEYQALSPRGRAWIRYTATVYPSPTRS
jgi:hypothetical protein